MKRPEPTAKSANETSDKHQRILDAAIEVIAEHGFFHSRVSEIADRAGVADGTIYLYFKNKDELLMAAIDSAFHKFIQRARTAVEQIPDPREKLRRMAFLHLEGLGSNRNLAIVLSPLPWLSCLAGRTVRDMLHDLELVISRILLARPAADAADIAVLRNRYVRAIPCLPRTCCRCPKIEISLLFDVDASR